MGIDFYDNGQALDDTTMADVDRVYCFDWPRFGEAEWAVLDRVYRSLPGWQVYREVPFWFGTEDTDIPHLYASVEPSGLQVCGVLLVADWNSWVSQFEAGVADLPSFQCE